MGHLFSLFFLFGRHLWDEMGFESLFSQAIKTWIPYEVMYYKGLSLAFPLALGVFLSFHTRWRQLCTFVI